MPETYITKVETIIYKFILNDKPQLISRELLCCDFNQGLVRMLDSRSQIKVIQVKMILKLLKDEGRPWSLRARYFINIYCGILSRENLECLHLNIRFDRNIHIPNFYANIVSSFKELGVARNHPTNIFEIQQEILWHNKLIEIIV